jgi:hypothetical protein
MNPTINETMPKSNKRGKSKPKENLKKPQERNKRVRKV